MNPLELTGRATTHIVQNRNPQFSAGKETVSRFLEMRAEAEKAGIDLQPVSAFRNFDSQLSIWNNKYKGLRPLYDRTGNLLAVENLSEKERVLAILNWSAIPGGSRHHWGTDIDVMDGNAIPQGYTVQLIPAEFSENGIFYPLNCWLKQHMTRFGFFRPYVEYRGGISPEPWHISFAHASEKALNAFSLTVLEEALLESDVFGKKTILDELPGIYKDYILNISPAENVRSIH